MQNKNINYELLFKNIDTDKNPVLIAMHNVGALGIKRGLLNHNVDVIGISNEKYMVKALGDRGILIEDKDLWLGCIKKIGEEYSKRSGKKIVFLTDGDQTMNEMVSSYDEISRNYILPIKNNIQEYEMTTNKELLREGLKDIRIPVTYVGKEQYGIEEFPVLIKPLSKPLSREIRKNKKVIVANNKEELKEILTYFESHGGCIAQEIIEGGTESLFCVTMYRNENGYSIIGNVVKKLREYPTVNGTGSCHVTVDNAQIAELALKVLEEKNYVGVAMVEFKYSEKTGEYVLIEVNGRFPIETNINDKIGNDFVYRVYKDIINPEKNKDMIFQWSDKKAYWVAQSHDIRACLSKKINWQKEYRKYKKMGTFIDAVKDENDPVTYREYVKRVAKKMLGKVFKKKKK